MRLNRFLARCGIASRRRSDDLIQSGIVLINGEVVDEPGRVVALGVDQVEYHATLGQEPLLDLIRERVRRDRAAARG